MPIGQESLDHWFTYHAPEGLVVGTTILKVDAYERIRSAAKALAEEIVACTPACADQSAAIRLVREASMTANAAIACDGR